MPEDEDDIRIGKRQTIEELTGGRIRKAPTGRETPPSEQARERAPEPPQPAREPRPQGAAYNVDAVAAARGIPAEEEDYEAARQGYKPGMKPEVAKEKGLDAETFVSQETKHHREDLELKSDRAAAAALSEAREGGFEVPRREKEED